MAVFSQTVSGTNDIQGHGTSTFNGVAVGREGASDKYTGVRYTSVTIPAGSTINSATVALTAAGMGAGSVANLHVKVSCEAADNPAAFGTGGSSRIFSATPTTAQTDWDPASWGVGATVTSPSFAAAVQEVINRPGWASGNALAVLIRNDGSPNDTVGEGNDNTAALTIDYTEGSGGGGSTQPPRSLHQCMMRGG